MPKVFLSYRRDDTRDMVGRLADRLRETPGVSTVFLDVVDIEPAEDFLREIKAAVAASPVRLIVIGKQWATITGADGRPRLAAPNDVVAAEVRQALTAPGRSIPVLVNGAPMPPPEALPEAIRDLATLNGLPLRHEHFEEDFERLTNAILNRKRARGIGAYLARHPVQAVVMRGSIGLVSAALLFFALLLANGPQGRFVSLPLGGTREAAMLIAAAVLLAGTLAGALWRGRRR